MLITTWNSQGDPTKNPEKADILHKLLGFSDFILIQECGAMSRIFDFAEIRQHVLTGHVGAYNERCSTCIVSKYQFTHTELYLGTTGRYAIFAFFGGFSIATLHAYSGDLSGVDIASTLKAVTMGCPAGKWIIGGDMNMEPNALLALYGGVINTGTSSRPGQIARIVKSNKITHPNSSKELDYFLVGSAVTTNEAYMYRYHGGDHHPVCINIKD